ncbi:hypothetical protein GEMMAAP_13005 [Gemmatimonas phototrophica]|uniref:Uncharacterized protein n=1 Tax=Gemmatimonas phototrophica TaxID=1379270 RepID=A0A143BKB7_9BACT|nr:hypothetical protein GEMMAAP_13005 [Gemmatimonas phototrophica]
MAADKFRAAQRPAGWMPPSPAAAKPEDPSMMGGRALYATGKPSRQAGAQRARMAGTADYTSPPVSASVSRAERDHVLVTSLVVVFVMLTIAIASLKVSGSMTADRSRTAVSGTLTKVYAQQSAFRILNQRFATWPELRARGMTLPTEQRVVESNASRSHWFMSVRDTNTGIICSRTGELFDDSPLDRKPSCSTDTK